MVLRKYRDISGDIFYIDDNPAETSDKVGQTVSHDKDIKNKKGEIDLEKIKTRISFLLKKGTFPAARGIYKAYAQYISKNRYETEVKRYLDFHNKRKIEEKIKEKIKKKLIEKDFKGADAEFASKSKEGRITKDEYIQIKKRYIKQFFNDPDCKKINDEKYNILASDDKYTLIKARAGTGKSTALQYKMLFLHKGYSIDPLDMIIFSFNKSTANKMNKDIIGLGIPYFDGSMTFHRFAGSMVLGLGKDGRDKVLTDREPSGGGKKTQSEVVQDIISDIFSHDNGFTERMYEYFKKEVNELERENLNISKLDYYDKIRNTIYEGELTQETLNGERVRSVGEKWIADFLFEHDISYVYERSTYANSKNQLDETYHPDFVLTDFSILDDRNRNDYAKRFDGCISTDGKTGYRISIANQDGIPKPGKTIIEHRGIDLNSPKQSVPQRRTKTWLQYKSEIDRKRDFLDKEGYTLIETGVAAIDYSSQASRTDFESFLRNRIEISGIVCNRLPITEILDRVKHKHKIRFTSLCAQYIKKAKQKGFSSEELKDKSRYLGCSEKAKIFYKLANRVFERYEAYLNSNGLIDMEDVLQNAVHKLDAVKGDISIKRAIGDRQFRDIPLNGIKYLMVDEYQDCNRLFFEIIDRIRTYNKDIKIICVGDDRQLINGFAGSDIHYFKGFKDNFSPAQTLLLRETFRCPNSICQMANRFYDEVGGSYSNVPGGNVKGYYLDDSFIEMRQGEHQEQYDADTIFFPKEKKKKKDGNGNPIKDFAGNHIHEKDIHGNIIYEHEREMYNMRYARYMKRLFTVVRDNFNLNKIFILHRTGMPFDSTSNKVKKHLHDLLLGRYKDSHDSYERDDAMEEIIKKVEFKTIHASKGLEADLVIMIEIGTNKYPMLHPDNELNMIFGETINDVLDEERRLFYVALTRTKSNISYIFEKQNKKNIDHKRFLIDSRGFKRNNN